MLSICTTIKNRSRVHIDNETLFLFPNCIESLSKSITHADDVELVIADWGSSDWPIKDWIADKIPHVPIHIVNIVSDSFSAGKGRNIAAQHAKGDILFFMDADMIVNMDIIQTGIKIASTGNVFYPTVKYEIEKSGKQIIHEGGGNLFISKDKWVKAGGWPEYWQHGFEDTDFTAKVRDVANIVTDNKISIFHQWHPQTKLFKNIHAKEDKVVEKRKQHYKKKEKVRTKRVESVIDAILQNNPNTTHSKLHKPVKGISGEMKISHV